jgi:aspartyl protease family protein
MGSNRVAGHMFRYIAPAASVLILSIAIAQSIGRSGLMETRAPETALTVKTKANSSGSRIVAIPARDGHFVADARINNQPLHFIVDTGATSIALRESDANAIGIRPFPDEFKVPVSTANGMVKAARAALNRVEIGGIELRDVEALILPDKVLFQNLLGMSFLSRVRWTHETGRLVLEQ